MQITGANTGLQNEIAAELKQIGIWCESKSDRAGLEAQFG